MERLFFIIQFTTVAIFFLIGAMLYRMGSANVLIEARERAAIQTTFVMDEPQKKEPPRPRPQEQKRVDAMRETEKKTADDPPPPPRERQVRQVFGLRKVFSQGIGEGGEDDAIVGRIGNTLDRNADTSAATADDLRGRGVRTPQENVTTRPPRLSARFRRMKPQYSPAMLDARVEGVVRARIMIGTDGAVRRVEILEDIGYDSADIAREFLMGLQFEPAMRGDEPVSVWIPFSIRFELV